MAGIASAALGFATIAAGWAIAVLASPSPLSPWRGNPRLRQGVWLSLTGGMFVCGAFLGVALYQLTALLP